MRYAGPAKLQTLIKYLSIALRRVGRFAESSCKSGAYGLTKTALALRADRC